MGNNLNKMGNFLNKASVLDRIKECYSLKDYSDLACFLGVSSNTITNWYSRNTFDIETICTKCLNTSRNWLMSIISR